MFHGSTLHGVSYTVYRMSTLAWDGYRNLEEVASRLLMRARWRPSTLQLTRPPHNADS